MVLRFQSYDGRQIGDRITLSAYVKDRSFRPATDEEQEVILRPPDQAGQEERIRLKLVEPGVYEKSFVAVDVGDYRAWILPEEGLSGGSRGGSGCRHAPRLGSRRPASVPCTCWLASLGNALPSCCAVPLPLLPLVGGLCFRTAWVQGNPCKTAERSIQACIDAVPVHFCTATTD